MFRRPAAALHAALFIALASGSAAALEAVTSAELVMRVAPGGEHRALASIPVQTRVTVNGCIQAEHWCLVRFGGRHGWVQGDRLIDAGISRPPKQQAQPPSAPQVIAVPVPVAVDVYSRAIVSADDVIVGVGETFGLAALGGGKSRIHFGKRHQRLHFGKRGIRPGKIHGIDAIRFGKIHHRFDHSAHKGGGHGVGFGTRHHNHFTAKRGGFTGHSSKVRFSGPKPKGGWRP